MSRIEPCAPVSTMRIPERHLDCVIYLYKSAIDATRGSDAGGSGFLVSVPSEGIEGNSFLYAVTNAHVIQKGFPVVRLNTTDGASEHILPKQRDWLLSKEDDLAVRLVDVTQKYKVASIPFSNFVLDDKAPVKFRDIEPPMEPFAPGDEVMMLGRFIAYDRIQQNKPVVRFGRIALMPAVEIEKDNCDNADRSNGGKQLSYLIECKSISGFSGSPVLVYRRNPFYPHKGPRTSDGSIAEYQNWLLGVDWCHLTVREQVYDSTSKGELLRTNQQTLANSGIAGVVPASRLRDLL
jgi:hypothetical protein